jgi:hypothetical protein
LTNNSTKIEHTLSPPSEYNCFCILKRIVGTLFPLSSYEHCIDFAETPNTFTLHNLKTKLEQIGLSVIAATNQTHEIFSSLIANLKVT